MDEDYKKISEFITKTIAEEKGINFLEWIHIPFIDYPLIVRVTTDRQDADRIELGCQKYLSEGLMIIVRTNNAPSGKKIEEILKEPIEPYRIPDNKLNDETRRILSDITIEATKYLASKNIHYTCLYEIMYEDGQTPVFNVTAPAKHKEESGLPELKVFKPDNREIQIAHWPGLNGFLNLIHLTEKAHEANKSLINYLDDLYKDL